MKPIDASAQQVAMPCAASAERAGRGCGHRAVRRPRLALAALAFVWSGVAFVGSEDRGAVAHAALATGDDTDLDGLSNDLEAYLTSVSSSPTWDVSPFNGDTDGDGQPDGFEFCLSGRFAPNSPGVVQPVVPRITLASHQSGSDIVVSLYSIPGALSLIDDFRLYVAARTPGQSVQLIDFTPQVAYAIEDVSFVWWGPYQMAVLSFRIPVELIRKFESVAVAAVGRLADVALGDTMSLAWHSGRVYRWTYFGTKAEGGSPTSAIGFAEPQDGAVSGDWTQDQVCGSLDLQVPTGTPGVLESVVTSIGCTTGAFACNGGICSDGGAADVPKLILDVDLLLGL